MAGAALEVRLSGGYHIVVQPGFDRSTLLALVAALERGHGDPAPGQVDLRCTCRRWRSWTVRRVPRSLIAKAPSLRGNAPIGIDGKPIEIHHVNQNPQGPYMEVQSSEHRRLKTRRPGLTTEERRLFELAKIRYWERQWDLGRFTDLPG